MTTKQIYILGGLFLIYIVNAISTPGSPWFIGFVSLCGFVLFGAWLVWENRRLQKEQD